MIPYPGLNVWMHNQCKGYVTCRIRYLSACKTVSSWARNKDAKASICDVLDHCQITRDNDGIQYKLWKRDLIVISNYCPKSHDCSVFVSSVSCLVLEYKP